MNSIARKILGGVVYSSASNFLIRAISTISYILILRVLSLHDYGIFVLFTSLIAPASGFVFFGFDRIFVSNFARALGRGDLSLTKRLFVDYYKIAVAVVPILFVAMLTLKNLLAVHYTLYLIQFFWVVTCFMYSQIFFNLVQLFLEANGDFKTISKLQLLEAFVRGVLVISLISHLSVGNLIFIYSIAKIVAAGAGCYFFVGYLTKLRTVLTVQSGNSVLAIIKSYGKWDLARNIIDQFMGPLRLWIIRIFINIESVALYDFAHSIYGAVIGLVPVRTVIFPFISQYAHRKDLLRILVVKAQKYTLVVFGLIYVLAVIFAPLVIETVFPQFAGATVLVLIVLLRLFIEVYKIGQSGLLYAFDQQKFNFKLYPIAYTLNILLDIIFITLWGIIGLAISGHVYVLIIGYIVGRHLLKNFGMNSWDWRQFIMYDDHDRVVINYLLSFAKNKIPFASRL